MASTSYACGSLMTTGSRNTILGAYNGNQDSLDIRTADNYAVISDGAGNRQITMKEGQTLALDSAVPNAGTGITFPATQSASSDANTLDDYEEGNWTPNQGSGLTVVGTFSSTGKYTKVGRMVTIRGVVFGSTSVAGAVASIISSNLPFTVEFDTAGSYFNGSLSAGGQVDVANTSVYAVGTIAASAGIYFSATYVV